MSAEPMFRAVRLVDGRMSLVIGQGRSAEVTDREMLENCPRHAYSVAQLHDTRVGDLGLRTLLDDSRATLEHLNLFWTNITDRSAGAIAACGKLMYATVARTAVTDRFVAALAGHQTLTRLILTETEVTDDCIRSLASCPKLEFAAFVKTRLSDEGLTQLAAIPSLRWLAVGGSRVTEAGVERVRETSRLEIDTRLGLDSDDDNE